MLVNVAIWHYYLFESEKGAIFIDFRAYTLIKQNT